MRRGALATILLALAIALSLAGLAGEFLHTPNSDTLSLLDAGRRLIAGGKFGVDFLDLNPPFVYLFHIPVAWFAERLGVSAGAVFRLSIVFLMLAAVLLTRRVARDTFGRDMPVVSSVTAGALGTAFFLPPGAFGQREHLQTIFMLPAIVAVAARADGCWSAKTLENWAISLLAGVGLALKVTSGVALLLPALYLFLTRKSWKSEATAAIGIAMLLSLLGLAWAPAYLGVVRDVGPLYREFNAASFSDLLQRGIFSVIPLFTVAVLLLCSWRVSPRPLPVVLGLALVGYLCGVVAQGKGFSYHYYPAMATATTALMVLCAVRGHESTHAKFARQGVAGALLTLQVVWLVPILYERISSSQNNVERRLQAVSALVPAAPSGTTVAILSPRISDAYPLVTVRGWELTGRWPSLWWLATSQRGSSWLMRSVGEDLASEKPEVILARRAWPAPLGAQELGFDVVPFLAQDSSVAHELANYREVRRSGEFVVFRRRLR